MPNNCDICAQVGTTEVTEDNGEYSGAFGGWRRFPHLEEGPEDAGVGRPAAHHTLYLKS